MVWKDTPISTEKKRTIWFILKFSKRIKKRQYLSKNSFNNPINFYDQIYVIV